MPWWAWFLLGLWAALVIAFVVSIIGAREGWENEDGFHFGRKE